MLRAFLMCRFLLLILRNTSNFIKLQKSRRFNIISQHAKLLSPDQRYYPQAVSCLPAVYASGTFL